MPARKLFRVNANLKGKQLSAQTIASFFACLRCSNGDALTTRPMSKSALLFLNRNTAVNYWKTNGWLVEEGETLALTASGLTKVRDRLAGKAGAQSVGLGEVNAALSVILNGLPGKSDETTCKEFEI